MRGAYGKPQGTVARVNIGQVLMSVRVKDQHRAPVIEALRRAKYKFPGRQHVSFLILFFRNLKSCLKKKFNIFLDVGVEEMGIYEIRSRAIRSVARRRTIDSGRSEREIYESTRSVFDLGEKSSSGLIEKKEKNVKCEEGEAVKLFFAFFLFSRNSLQNGVHQLFFLFVDVDLKMIMLRN